MPFGCLALRDGRTYNSLSDITDKYEIGQVLKAKEFCELCLVKEQQTDKVYVCKKFLKKDGKKVRKAAKNEIMILKMVNHPNILKLIDAFETRKEFYIIQELATGGDVFDWILDQGNYTERDAANVIRQVLEAVAYLHSLNIVHRNLKLENLMYYTENNHKKVVLRDFYLSRFENGSITEPCGTPEYLAPEVVARHRYGRPVDCWAIGVIMYMLLSGNPPFYDETEEENTDMHNRIIFCRIVAGDYEFDSPYWDDISPAAKELLCRLMEVDQMLRITAQDALWHEWIAGNGASEKNLKDGVCAQFEKNFAKAKWRKAIRVTTFMQRLRASELGSAEVTTEGKRSVQADEEGSEGVTTDSGGVSSVSMSNEVTVESAPVEVQERKVQEEKEMQGSTNLDTSKPLAQTNSATQTQVEEQNRVVEKKATVDGSHKMAAMLGQEKPEACKEPTPSAYTKSFDCPKSKCTTEKEATDKKITPDSRRRMAANLSLDHGLGHGPKAGSPTVEKEQAVANEEKAEAAGKQEKSPRSWCQTQLPETVAEGQVGPGTIGETSPGDGEMEEDGRDMSGRHAHSLYASIDSSSLGHKKTVYVQEQRDTSHGAACRNPYCSPYSVSSGAAYEDLQEGDASTDWQMDSVIEQIEKQMAAVLEKIEGDMPSLLEHIRDCPESLPRAKSAQSSPSFRHRSSHDRSTPPPLPTTPRPTMPSLPHLTIPPPSYPPPNPPTQTQGLNQLTTEQDDQDEQRGSAKLSQSPRGAVSGKCL
ncbi:caM kinase-like vesicle-associated, like isoform X2 [Clarias gariepinus]|nr:caM kinase-like vesicle-associated, like isoform X2 [Clarias gariepinus]XP_053339411.1 caM kinase-like vesicle-associated, like isoform X2 [Clarias gariepinus]XP_053339412.1 caM kinase-like vesicle-associated, like isoform X2 [Clarias gariepinus]